MIQDTYELYKMKAELCKTFSDPTRLMIINELRKGEKAVGELAQIFKMNQAVISRQLAILRQRGVVKARREGTNVFYSLADANIGKACDLIQEVLLNQLEENKQLVNRFNGQD